MKKITKALSLALALALVVMSVSVTAVANVDHESASGSYTITITGLDSDATAADFSLYQIFIGDVAVTSGTATLSNVAWGGAVSSNAQIAAFITALNSAVSGLNLATDASATEVSEAITTNNITSEVLADVIATYIGDANNSVVSYNPSSSSVSSNTYTATVDAGYYFIVNSDTSANSGGIVLVVVGNTTATGKISTSATTTKELVNSSLQAETDKSVSPGDTVTFKITVDLPSTLYTYDTYSIQVVDTAENLTNLSVSSITLNDKDNTSNMASDLTSGQIFSTTGNTNEYALTQIDLTDSSGVANTTLDDYVSGHVVIIYTAQVGADYTYDTTTNTAYTKYTNDPTSSTLGGTTPSSTVTLYEYRIIIHKVDNSTTPVALAGANFTLDGNSATSLTDVSGDSVTDNSSYTAANFTFDGYDTGSYTLSETHTPDGYNSISDMTLVISATTVANGTPSVTVTLTDSENNTVANMSTTDGTYEYNIVNKSGPNLPETGGMGTKIFYTLGGILVAGAAVLLVVKRRMRTV
ncbi:MAG: LPXTG cell wall anchor domain-containing protein, partial [Clostridiales bacterium]|nr:LPXTG cell wall anchor domain-containing protein [Clostridiales bacterium]